jgi:carboxyl-terminal processing protease
VFSLDEFASNNPSVVPNLSEFLANDGSLGNLKLTVQKFYRINGGSTQLNGVVPDVTIPDVYMFLESGERRYESALPYDAINSTTFSTVDAKGVSAAVAASKQRISNSAYFKLVTERAAQLKKQQDDNVYSLNIKKYRQQLEEVKVLNKSIEELDKGKELLDIYNCRADMDRVLQDDVSKKKNEDWLKGLKKDATVKEAVNIVQDLIKA